MVATVRHAELTNTTGAIKTSVPVEVGQDYSFQSIVKTFITAEIGNAAGQTYDATTTAKGFLFAQFRGAVVKRVIASALIKSVSQGTPALVWDKFTWGTAANSSNLGFRVSNDSSTGISSLYLYDFGTSETGDSTLIANGDRVYVLVELGNS